jgi:hypothetical protein
MMLKIIIHQRFFLPLYVNMVAMIIAILILQLVTGGPHFVSSFTLQSPSTTRVRNTVFTIDSRERKIRNRSTSLEGIRGFRAWVCIRVFIHYLLIVLFFSNSYIIWIYIPWNLFFCLHPFIHLQV